MKLFGWFRSAEKSAENLVVDAFGKVVADLDKARKDAQAAEAAAVARAKALTSEADAILGKLKSLFA